MNDSEFTVRNPDFQALVAGSFAKQGLMAHLGARLSSVEPGRVQIEVDYRPELTQQQGLFHGGVTTAIVDSACGYSALTLMPPGSEVLTVEFKINLMAPASGQRLIARGHVVRSGRTITVCQGEAYAVEDGTETLCAMMTATMIRVDAPT